MEAIGGASAIVGLADVIANRISHFRVRLDRFRQQPEHFHILHHAYDRINTKLEQLQHCLRTKDLINEDLRLIEKHVKAAQSELEKVSSDLDFPVDMTRLPTQQPSQSSNASSRFRRKGTGMFSKKMPLLKATRIEESLTSIRGHLDSAWRVMSDARLTNIESKIGAVSEALDEKFVPNIVVSPNPENLAFDFISKDENGIPVTCEGKLKQAVLGAGSSSCIGVFERTVSSAVGSGGMGKTCAVRALSSLREVRNRFPGGLYEISLGMDAGEQKLKRELCNCIEKSGGVELAKELFSERSFREVLRRAEGWFGSEKVLFVVDDVWENGMITRHLLLSLKRLLGFSGSRMVFTTRSSTMSSISSDVVEFGLRGPFSHTSKMMLLENTNMSENDPRVKTNAHSFRKLLEVCGGLPVALAVAGHLVREHGRGFRDPFAEVVSRIVYRPEEIRTYPTPGYGALSNLLDAAVEFCEMRYGNEWKQRMESSFREIMQSLCVLQKQQFAPARMLQRLWCLDNIFSVKDLAMILKNAGLVKDEVRLEHEREEFGIRLHDLTYEHFASIATNERIRFHLQLLGGYISEHEDDDYREWWNVDEKQDMFLYQNLCRLLCCADLLAEAVWVLLDPRWTVKQIRMSGVTQALREIEFVVDEVRKCSTRRMGKRMTNLAERTEALELIQNTIALAAPFVSRSRKEIWFQLYGRLAENCHLDAICAYLARIEIYAERPWLRAGRGCVARAGGFLERTWVLDRELNTIKYAWFDRDGSISAMYMNDFEIECLKLENMWQTWKSLWRTTAGASVCDSTFCVHKDQLGLVLSNGRAQVLDVQNRRRFKIGNVKYVKIPGNFSDDGTRWAFLCKHNVIRIWSRTGDEYRELCVFEAEDEVTCLCMSPDGLFVAVGCRNGLVVLWNVKTKKVWNALSVDVDEPVLCVSFSSIGRLLATSSRSKGTSIWDFTSEVMSKPVQLFHCWGLSQHFKWSPDGLYVAATTVSKGVRIWKIPAAPGAKGETWEMKSSGKLVCMNWAADCRKLLTVDSSNTVHVSQVSSKVVSKSYEHKRGIVWRRAKWCNNGTMLAAIWDEGIDLLNQQGTTLAELSCRRINGSATGYALDITWADDGIFLGGVYAFEVQVWNVHNRQLVSRIHAGELGINGAALSADGSILAVATRADEIQLWRTYDAEMLLTERTDLSFTQKDTLLTHYRNLKLLTFSPDGRYLAMASYSTGSIRIWDLTETGSYVLPIKSCCWRHRLSTTDAAVTCCDQVIGDGSDGVHELSFDKCCNIIIEWELPITDTLRNGRNDQFTLWRWHSDLISNPLHRGRQERIPLRKRAHVQGRKLFLDDMHNVVGRSDYHLSSWCYNERTGAIASIAEGGRLVFCFLERDQKEDDSTILPEGGTTMAADDCNSVCSH